MKTAANTWTKHLLAAARSAIRPGSSANLLKKASVKKRYILKVSYFKNNVLLKRRNGILAFNAKLTALSVKYVATTDQRRR